MSADPIIYCLQQLTDYRQFERLCSDIMAGSGYTNIEPLGGTSDRGRDAIYVSSIDPNDITVFAYSVRSDWHQKLLQDSKRIKEEGHILRKLAFVCTSPISTSQKEAAKEEIRASFGWELELFDLERLRVRLASDLRHLTAQHSSIFCPPWFPTRGGLSISESRDTVVIDHVSRDHAMATWLARRLQLAGYRIWCYGTAPLAGESADASVRLLIEKRAVHYLPILSSAAIEDADLMGRCGLACGIDGLTIPCWSAAIITSTLSSRMRELTPVRFDGRWSEGLGSLLDTFQAKGVVADIDGCRSKAIALRSYVPESVTRPIPERVYANVFHVSVPPAVIVCELEQELRAERLAQLRHEWAFAIVSPTKLLSFDVPPTEVKLIPQRRLPELSWADCPTIEGKPSLDVVKELIWRSLDVACFRAGFVWCDNRKVLHFPFSDSPQHNISFRHLDGRNTRVGVTGERSRGQGAKATTIRYQLGPRFRIGQDEAKAWWATMRIYVRTTDCRGKPLEGKAIGRSRKAVTKSWWNKQWLARTLGIMQAISKGAKEVTVGAGNRMLTVSTAPLEWECPVSIDVDAVRRIGDFQEEMAALRYVEDDNDADKHDECVCESETKSDE